MASVAAEQDTLLVVRKSDDLMSATISVQPPGAAAQFSVDQIIETLKSKNIRITDEVRARVDEFAATFSSGEIPEDFLVARGTPPAGRDEQFVWDEKYDKTLTEWQEEAPVDFYSLNSIVTVEKGEVFGHTEPLIPAASGTNIEGTSIAPTCSPKTLKIDESIARSQENPSELVAAISGRVVQQNETLLIDEVLFVHGDVSFESGNVDASVDVHIKGRVPDRFEVSSAKNVTVGSAVEAAKVTAGRNLTVRNGIAARGAGLVTAGATITAKFCSDANLVANGDIKIAKQAMNSQICAGGRFLGESASMIGGSLLASGDIHLRQTGSQRNIITRIVTGIKPEVVRQAAQTDRRINRVGELTQKLEELMDGIAPQGVSEIEGGVAALDAIKTLMNQSKQSRATETQRMEELLNNVYVDSPSKVFVSGTIFPGTRIRIADRRVVFHKEQKGPIAIEKRKIENVTELVAVNTLTGSVSTLKSEKRDTRSLLEGFELEELPDAKPESTG